MMMKLCQNVPQNSTTSDRRNNIGRRICNVIRSRKKKIAQNEIEFLEDLKKKDNTNNNSR